MKFQVIVVSLMVTVSVALADTTLSDGMYRIENYGDKLHVTTQGGGSTFASVVGENWLNYAEQKWKLKKIHEPYTFSLTPEKFQTNNALSFFKTGEAAYAIPQEWVIFEGDKKKQYQIRNKRTGLCLSSAGRRKELLEVTCNRFLPAQLWIFYRMS